MQLYFLTSVGWSLDSSGNLQARDTAGNLLAKFLSGSLSTKGNKGTLVSNTILLSTTSTVLVNAGVGTQITPQISTTIFVFAWVGSVSNNTVGDGAQLVIGQYSGSVNPAGGSATSGPIVLQGGRFLSAAISQSCTLSIPVLVTGLTIGSAYTFECLVAAVTGGTAAFSADMTISAVEL